MSPFPGPSLLGRSNPGRTEAPRATLFGGSGIAAGALQEAHAKAKAQGLLLPFFSFLHFFFPLFYFQIKAFALRE